MRLLLKGGGLRYNEKANAVGAQTERQGLAGPGRDLLGGETSPAALVSQRIHDKEREEHEARKMKTRAVSLYSLCPS